jgi:hypothetical protein
MSIDLKGPQIEAFRSALMSAFLNYPQLEMMVRLRLDAKLQEIAAPAPLPEVAFNLILWAEQNDHLDELLAGALATVPTNRRLRLFAQEVALSSKAPPSRGLEAMLLPGAPFQDVAQWRARLARVELCVGRVDAQQDGNWYPLGTGFLVAPNLLMTNWHVAEPIVSHKGRVQLDFALDSQGATKPSRECGFIEGPAAAGKPSWLLASSPIEKLDYALVRLGEAVGDDAVPGTAGKREFLRPNRSTPAPGEPLLILQHPEAQRLKLGIGSVRAAPASVDAPRIEYTTNTKEGSSGSPCFTLGLDLVALHQRGDNAGIPLSAIVDDMRSRSNIVLPA